MIIIGHRGAPGLEPENTIRSFKKAEELGVSMVEFDVRSSKDGQIVVTHDHDLLRLFGDPRAIKDLALAEIKRVSSEHSREIPTLDEVLSVLNVGVNIEIKVHGIEAAVLEKVKNFPHKVLISSFYPGVVKKIRTLDGNIPLGLNFMRSELRLEHLISFLTRKVKLSSIHIENRYVTWANVNLVRLLAPKVYVWTINNAVDFQKMEEQGIDGIFTDHPELFN